MNKEKDFFKTCFNTVAGLEVKNESQAIAKEVVLSEIENLQQENKILRENAENNDKVVDKVNWENMLLKKENKQLKKQVDEYKKLGFKYLQDKNNDLETQQKEFINYLEDLIKFYKNRDSYMVIDIHGSYDLNNIELELLEEILQKYKEIIGDDK